jgi:hypothetical protein
MSTQKSILRKIRWFVIIGLISSSCSQQNQLTPEQAKQIAEEAYIYAYPMLDHYKMMFAMAIHPESGAYEAPFNILINKSTLLGPEHTVIVRPNNDTFYSAIWLNLTGEPIVLKVPAVKDNRYYSFQIIDMYTHNIDYIGTRETGFDEGAYLLVGPDWEGEIPEGINKVIQSEGNYYIALGRTQVFGSNDVETAIAHMEGYKTQLLSEFLGKESTAQFSDPAIPAYHPEKVKSIEFIAYLNGIMAGSKIHESEKAIFEKFAKIGIAPGKAFDATNLDPAITMAIQEGITSGMEKIITESTQLGQQKNGWQLISGITGNREVMQGKFLIRAAAAYFGLWGNSLDEAYYPEASVDADGDVLNCSKQQYVLHFDADEIPPVKAFWSLSMYKLPEQLFIENDINRYVISSATDGLKYNDDGSLDIYIQKENPGSDNVSNWLPAYDGLFSLQARLYWPNPKALKPLYVPPPIQKQNK